MINKGLKFKRVCRLIIGKNGDGDIPSKGLSFDQRFRFEFDIVQTAYKTPNTGTIKIYNLRDETFAKIQDEFDDVVLMAGYEKDPPIIFRGSIKFRYKYREGNDHIIMVDVADGDKDYKSTNVNFTLRKESTERQAIDMILNEMKSIRRGYVAGSKLNKKSIRGRVYSGPARDILTQIADNNDALWSFQNGRYVMVPVDSTLPTEAIKVSSETGLIGAPEMNDKGIAVKMMLEPRAVPNGKLWLANNEIKGAKFKLAMLQQDHSKKKRDPVRKDPDGVYKMFVVNHKGDTRGTEWVTEVKCVGLDQKIPTSKKEVPLPMEDGPDEF